MRHIPPTAKSAKTPKLPEHGGRGPWGRVPSLETLHDCTAGSCSLAGRAGTVAALAAVPGTAGQVLAATAAGLHVSDDGGQRWRWIALGPHPVVEAIAVSAGLAEDQIVLLGTASGVHRSTDGGRRWRHVLPAAGYSA